MMRNFSIRYLTIILFFLATVNAWAQGEVYQIQNPIITAIGSGKLKDLKPQFTNVNISGEFAVENQTLANISDLNINLSLSDSLIIASKVTRAIKKELLENGLGKINFSQVNFMNLPLMKMYHLTMDVKLPNGNHFSPLSLYCKLEDDKSISVSGEQTIYLYQLGIVPKNIKKSHTDDLLVLAIKFSLVKSSNLIAKQAE